MLYVLLEFDNGLTEDALVDWRTYVRAIVQSLNDNKPPPKKFKIDDSPSFQIQVANGQLEKPIATTTLAFDIGDNTFAKHSVVMTNLTGPIISLHYTGHNNGAIDTTHGVIHFPHLTMQAKNAVSAASAKLQPVFFDDSTTVPLMTTKTIKAFVDHFSEWHITGTVTPVEKFKEAANLLTSHSTLTIFDKKTAVRINNTKKSPSLFKKTTQTAQFYVVNPQQSSSSSRWTSQFLL